MEVHCGGVKIRLARTSDADKVVAAFHPQSKEIRERFGKLKFNALIEQSLYSFVGVNADNDVLAFAAFNDTPLVPGVVYSKRWAAARAWAIKEASDLGFLMESLLWLEICVTHSLDDDAKDIISRAFVRAVFSVTPSIQVILQLSESGYVTIPRLLKPMSYLSELKLQVSACMRSTVTPLLKIRRAKQEDYDDLVPVIERAITRGLPLAQVPTSATPAKPYAVARLIAAQDDRNTVYVAEADNVLVGMMATTTDVHQEFQYYFDLAPYAQLTVHDESATQVCPGSAVKNNHVVSPAEGARPSLITLASELTGSDPGSMPLNVLLETQIVMHDEDQGVVGFDSGPEQAPEKPKRIINAFQIIMFCIEEEFENQSMEFVSTAFKSKNEDYCLVGYPYVCKLPPLLQLFIRVPSRHADGKAAAYHNASELCLYLLHRGSLSPGFEVRICNSADAHEVDNLLEGFADSKAILESINHPKKGCLPFVAELFTEIVGFALLQESVPLEMLESHFDLNVIAKMKHYPPEKHAVITFFALVPTLSNRRRLFLREIMRQTGKSMLYYPIFPSQQLPDIIEDLVLIPGRQHAHMLNPEKWGKPTECFPKVIEANGLGTYFGYECSLYATTHRLTCRHKIQVNSRVVVIGASHTAQAFLRKLLMFPQLDFTNLTLISPFGFLTLSSPLVPFFDLELGPAWSFHKLGLDCEVHVIAARLVDINRGLRNITLDSGQVVPYDYLVLCTGLQDQTIPKLSLDSIRTVIRAEELLVRMQGVLEAMERVRSLSREEYFVVYGSSLEALFVIQLLLSQGFKSSEILLVHPAQEIFQTPCFGDKITTKIIMKGLIRCGIEIRPCLHLVGVNIDETGNLPNYLIFEEVHSTDTMEDSTPRKVHVPYAFLITCNEKHVDVSLFHAMKKEGIIFDGRVIVDGKFQTNDPSIYAGGSLCKVSRRCAKIPKLETYNCSEVGERMADSLISRFRNYIPGEEKLWPGIEHFASQSQLETPHKLYASPVPVLIHPKGTGGCLPGNLQLINIVIPSYCSRDLDDANHLIKRTENSYIRFDVLETKQVARLLYIGKNKTEPWKLSRFVGLHLSLLNSITKWSVEGNNEDVLAFLSQPWSSLLLHDKFSDLYHQICALIMDVGRHKALAESTIKTDIQSPVQSKLLEFLLEKRSDFPGYNLPPKIKEVVEDDDPPSDEVKDVVAKTIRMLEIIRDKALTADGLQDLVQQIEGKLPVLMAFNVVVDPVALRNITVRNITEELVNQLEKTLPVLISWKLAKFSSPGVLKTAEDLICKIETVLPMLVSLEITKFKEHGELKMVAENLMQLIENSLPVMLSLVST